jgi:hypothetical protein
MLRVIPAVECRIDQDSSHDPGHTKSNDRPVVTWLAATTGLPTVHPLSALGVLAFAPFRRRRLEHGLLRREELVVCRDDCAAELFGGEVNQVGEIAHRALRVER